ncbi:hypothetical protein PI126_g22336 [Phytophthora idaei]|nr:hypothetical protein PI126_g22336 [Phytophthora idaei]
MSGKRKQQAQCSSERTSKRRQSLRVDYLVGVVPTRLNADLASDRAMFRVAWRTLRDAGWAFKRSNQNILSDLHRYIPPQR